MTLQVELPLLESLGYVVDEDLYTLSSDLFLVKVDGDWYDVTFIGGEPGVSDSQWIRNRLFVGTRVPDVAARATTPPSIEGVDRVAIRKALQSARLQKNPLWGPRPPADR